MGSNASKANVMAANSLKVELSALSNSVNMRWAISFPFPECALQASWLASEKNVLVAAGLGRKERQLTILRLLCQNSNSRMQYRSKSNKESTKVSKLSTFGNDD